MMPCSHHTCAECLCRTIRQFGRIGCLDCNSRHLSSAQAPLFLLVQLLADQLAMCSTCKEPVQLKNMDDHIKRGCTEHIHISLQTIIQKPLNAPLTKIEEKVGSNIVRQWIQASDGTEPIRVPTGGPVLHTYGYSVFTVHSTYHTVHVHLLF